MDEEDQLQEDMDRDPNEPRDEDEKPEEEDEETIRQRELLNKFKDDIRQGLSNISKIANNGSYAFVKLNLADKEIEKLYDPICQYTNLRYLDLQGNQISEIYNITGLKFLCSLNLSRNKLTSL